jgi:hypothetical protein
LQLSVIEADASRYHGKAPDEIDWSLPERQTRAVAEFLTALDDDDATADRKLPKVIIHACSNHRLKKLVADSLSAAPPAIPG